VGAFVEEVYVVVGDDGALPFSGGFVVSNFIILAHWQPFPPTSFQANQQVSGIYNDLEPSEPTSIIPFRDDTK
jgi:hypothetical protein